MKRAQRIAFGVVATGCALASPAEAQESPAELRWSATVHYEALQVAPSPDGAYWHTATAGVGRRFDRGSVALQLLTTRRFELTERAVVADAYHDLWRGAYGNVRVAAAPGAEMLASVDVGAELFQDVGGTEVSGNFRHQRFDATHVSTLGTGLGLYAGNWYLRPRTLVANVEKSWSPFLALGARHYMGGSTDDLLDFTVGFGEEVLEVAPSAGEASLAVVTSGSRFAGARIQRYFGSHVGISAGGSYSAYDAIPDRWGLNVGVMTRW